MKTKQKRINAALKDLYLIHEQLFGQSYIVGVELDQNSQFSKVIQAFRELIFTIRQTQQERSKKQTQKKGGTPQLVKINYQIRQDITRAQTILREGIKRLKTEVKNQTQKQNRQKIIKNCYQQLNDVKEVEQGGTYKPPQYPTLNQIKKKLLAQQYKTDEGQISMNMEEEKAFEQFDQNDKKQDDIADQIIKGNQIIQNNLKLGNELIDEGSNKIKKNMKKVDNLNQRVQKANRDLAQILVTYRRPSQLCLDITLVLMILALIAVSINLIKGSINI